MPHHYFKLRIDSAQLLIRIENELHVCKTANCIHKIRYVRHNLIQRGNIVPLSHNTTKINFIPSPEIQKINVFIHELRMGEGKHVSSCTKSVAERRTKK